MSPRINILIGLILATCASAEDSPRFETGLFTLEIKSAMDLKAGGNLRFNEAPGVMMLGMHIRPRDLKEAFAFEVGDVFRLKDADGKEIEVQSASSHNLNDEHTTWLGRFENQFERMTWIQNPPSWNLAMRINLSQPAPKTIARLEGDLFVAKMEVFDFTFTKEEFKADAVKKLGDAQLKITKIGDENEHANLEFTLTVPKLSSANKLGRTRNEWDVRFALYSEGDGGALEIVRDIGTGPRSRPQFNPKGPLQVTEWGMTTYNAIPRDRRMHLVVFRPAEYPRTIKFTLKNVELTAPAMPRFAPPVRRPRKIG
jgi:hypothetical protein